jgi:CheY-like chemotaxis protein
MKQNEKAPNVLVADDNDEIRELVCVILRKRYGLNIECVEDGQQAIELYDKWRDLKNTNCPYDILILDAAMPNATGFEVAKHVRSRGDECAKIICITADTDPIARPHADSVGAVLVYKPFVPTDLYQVIEMVCPKMQKARLF